MKVGAVLLFHGHAVDEHHDGARELIKFDRILNDVEQEQFVIVPVGVEALQIDSVNSVDFVAACGHFVFAIHAAHIYIQQSAHDLHLERPEDPTDGAEHVLARQLYLTNFKLALLDLHTHNLTLVVEPELLRRLAHAHGRPHEHDLVRLRVVTI